jgi:FAD binding domain/Berberine and berberine like
MTNAEVYLVQRDLTGMVLGRVIGAGDQGYSDALSIDNGRVTLKPFLIAKPANTDDVSKIVGYCHDRGVPLTTKAGGHSAAGYCLNGEGVVLDLEDMNDIELLKEDGTPLADATELEEGRRVSVGAGSRWINVYDFLRDRQSPYSVIGGGCAGVGVAGFTLGGGYSFISRSFGLGCDNVAGMEFVSTCGNVFELKDNLFSKHPKVDTDKRDLFRALRGAGGGNFGVVTKIDLRLRKTAVPRPTMGQIDFPFYRIGEVLAFYNEWVNKLPKEMAVYGMMRNFPNQRLGGNPSLGLRFTPVFNGSFSDAVDLLKPMLALKPDDIELYTMTLPEWEDFVGTSTQVRGHSGYIRSLVLGSDTVNQDVVQICQYYMGHAVSNDSYVVWTHTGGAIGEHGSNTSSYAHRDGAFTFELKSEWSSAQPSQARPNIEWAVDFFDALGEHAQGAYINYIDPLLLDWQKKYYRDEYHNLEGIQKRWNADGWLQSQQSVGSSYRTAPRANPRVNPVDLSPLTRTLLTVKGSD